MRAAASHLLLELGLLLLLQLRLMLVELIDRICEDVEVVVRRVAAEVLLLVWVAGAVCTAGAQGVRAWLLLDPQILGRLEVVPEDRDDLLDLLV